MTTRVNQHFALPLLAAVLALTVGSAVSQRPGDVRLLVAAVVGAVAIIVASTTPASALILVFAALPFLALGRRMLLSFAPWASVDPLLLVAPAVAIVLLLRLYVLERRPLAVDSLSKLVLAFLILTVIQAANPRGGGVAAGAASLLFTAAPLVWFFIGRDLATPALVRRLLSILIAVACVAATYGFLQITYGFPSWDEAWIQARGYTSLNVSGSTRPFAMFSSSAEFATYVSCAIAVCVAAAARRHFIALLAIPPLAVAMFLQGSRGLVVVVVVGAVVVVAFRSGSPRGAIATTVVAVAVGAAALSIYGAAIVQQGNISQSPFVRHQISGLAHPLNSKQSTAALHVNALISGIRSGITDPLGHGTASVTLASDTFGATSRSTENDISNVFVALGLPGGLIFVAILVSVFRRAGRLALRNRDLNSLSVLGVLIVTSGEWLNGGFWALAPLIWLLIGHLVAETSRASAEAVPL